ncbi:hypothetical protein HMI55_001790 [Coelomomyces lativittatus]|nr:hypothetical protein HMI55_001790 [Coelomomyces lativittatus]
MSPLPSSNGINQNAEKEHSPSLTQDGKKNHSPLTSTGITTASTSLSTLTKTNGYSSSSTGMLTTTKSVAVASTNGSKVNIHGSPLALNTHNRIREIVDHLNISPNPEKKMITLALGDPTQSTHFQLHPNGVEAVHRQLLSNQHNGYVPSFGEYPARQAVAKFNTYATKSYSPEDVILTSGCSVTTLVD